MQKLKASLRKYFTAFLFLLLLPLLTQAQIPDPVSFMVTRSPSQIKTGETFSVTIKTNIEGNWHLYSINVPDDAGPFPTQITVLTNRCLLPEFIDFLEHGLDKFERINS